MSKMSEATTTARTATIECKMLAVLLPDEYYVKLFMPFMPTKRHGIKVYKKINGRVPWFTQGTLCAEVYPPSLVTKYEDASIKILDEDIVEMMMVFAEQYGYKKIIKEYGKKVDDEEDLPKVQKKN